MNDESSQLVSAAQQGDRPAFDRLVQMYQRQVVAVASRLLNNTDDGLEIAQEAFFRAYRSLGQLQDPDRFKAWLMRIVTNQALNFRRNRARRRTVSLDDDRLGEDRPIIAAPTEKGPDAAEQLAAGELAQAIREAIGQLPEKLRTSLELFAIEKMPQKEIAEIMQTNVQTVKWNVFEARRQLRKKLGKLL